MHMYIESVEDPSFIKTPIFLFVGCLGLSIFGMNSCIAESMKFSKAGSSIACRDESACSAWYDANGEITAETPRMFEKTVKANPDFPKAIRFTSLGGNLKAALQLGRYLRRNGFVTEAQVCASACTYAFMGGVERQLVSSTSRLGVHRFYRLDAQVDPSAIQFNGYDLDQTQRTSTMLLRYTDEMGVDPMVVSLSGDAGPADMHWIDETQARTLRLVHQPRAYRPWELQAINGGAVAISESEDRQVSMQLLCKDNALHFTVIDSHADEQWIQSCSKEKNHLVLGTIVPRKRVTVKSGDHGTLISFDLQTKRLLNFRSVAIFESMSSYPMMCVDITERYKGTTSGFKAAVDVAVKSCINTGLKPFTK